MSQTQTVRSGPPVVGSPPVPPADPAYAVAPVAEAPLHILLLEDSPLDAELTLAALDDAGVAHTAVRVDTADAFAAALEPGPAGVGSDGRTADGVASNGGGPDLILSDYLLPAFNGAAALRLARQRRPDVPFIFVSGVLGEETAIESLRDGATDYVLKQRLNRLGPAVRRAVREAADRRARARVEAGLRQSEDRYRFLADAVPQIVWSARPDGTLDYCNARWHQYTGLGVEQTRDGGWTVAVHPDDVPVVRDAWATARAADRPFEAEHRLRGVDGTYRWHLSRGLPRHAPDGSVEQWVGTTTDIDDRRRVEAEHRRLLGQLDAIIGTMNEGLAVADADGRILSMNAAGLRLHGMADAADLPARVTEMAGQIEFATLAGDPIPPGRWPMARALAGQTFADYPVRVYRPAAGRRWVGSYAGAPIRGDDGRVHMAVVTFRDVTAAVAAEAELAAAKAAAETAKAAAETAREQAEAANRSKDEFLATLSHELRTPLNAILGWTQLLAADPDPAADPAELRHGLATIERNARQQAQLIEDLLDVSRIVAGKLRLSRRGIDLRAVLAAAADGVGPNAAARGVALDLPANPDPVPVFGDPDRLQQVAWNLLTNAVKFTPAGGTVRATVATTPDGGADLVVADTGQGISADFLPHVFERFRQADGPPGKSAGGLGLGLAIVRNLAQQHGGTATAHSDGPGRGATFRVHLPPVADPAHPPAVTPSTAAPAAAAARSLAGVTVLVIDDEADARGMVATLLRRAGADVRTAACSADALAALTAAPPDVLVSDIAMPGGDGYGLVAAVRRLPPAAGGRTPAIALTAYAQPDDRQRALSAGFDAHLPKPVDAAALVAAIADRLPPPR